MFESNFANVLPSRQCVLEWTYFPTYKLDLRVIRYSGLVESTLDQMRVRHTYVTAQELHSILEL